MKKFLKIFFIFFVVIFVILFSYTIFSMCYPVMYGRFHYYTIGDGGAILDLYLTESDPEVFARIEFRDTHEEGGSSSNYVLKFYEYDSIVSIFGYYDISIFGHYNNRYNNDMLETGGKNYRLGVSIDRKLKKVIYQYQNHKVSITKDCKILEYGDIKIFLKHDQVTKIVIKNGEPFSIVVNDRWQFDPPIKSPEE